MKDRKNNILLILGASGYIGNYLFNQFRKEGFDVVGTYFKNKKPGLIHFDLENANLNDLKLNTDKITHLIIAAATNAKIDESKIYWDYNYKINVIRIKSLIDYCFKHDIIPIYLSSDAVFNGKKGNYIEEDKTNPINCYGKIRYEVENHIKKFKKPYVIIRAGRVFGTEVGDGTLITSMLKNMRKGENMKCATDQVFTPIYIEDFFNFIKITIEKKYMGIFHLASLKATNHYEIAKSIKKFFHFDNVELETRKIDSFDIIDKRPKLTSLNIEKYKKITGNQEKKIEYFLSLIK
tara:strand:+ start:180 stop:1058 length:879 start_codon:yes stop_codon:yes gene_type:complete